MTEKPHKGLVLTRKAGQSIHIDDDIVEVSEVRGRQVRIRVFAPPATPVLRSELRERLEKENRDAASKDPRRKTDPGASEQPGKAR